MPNQSAPNATSWTAAQTRAQFSAIAWLRWRILVNGFRRKGGAGELIARIIIYPILAALAFGPTIGVGIGAYFLTQNGKLDHVSWLLWGTFALCQLLNIQLGQPGSTFDPTQLIRFPLVTTDYIAIRLAFGILTPANVIGSMMSLAIAIGIGLAAPALWGYALLTLAVFAAANVLFSRMIFAWIDRWLATRRAREIFTALIFAVSLGIQWANFNYNPAYNFHSKKHHNDAPQKLAVAGAFLHRIQPFVQALPPELTSSSIVAAQQRKPSRFFSLTAGTAAYAALFLAVFGLRMRTEFRGESLSDAANGVARTPKKTNAKTSSAGLVPARVPAAAAALTASNAIGAMIAKEFLYVRRNMGLFYSVVAPLVFVFLFAGKLASRSSADWIFPAAVAYTLLGIAPLSFNSFGLEGSGAQFYFFAPVRLRDVMLAKNLMNFAVAAIEMVAVLLVISFVAGPPPPESIAVALLWAASTLLLSTILGNRRSISAPKQINLARAAGKQASPLSGLIAMGVLLASAALACGLFALALWQHVMWALVLVYLVLFAASLWAYERSLLAMDGYAQGHREELFAELTKKL